MGKTEIRTAGFWRRYFAHCLDNLIGLTAAFVLLYFLFTSFYVHKTPDLGLALLTILLFLAPILLFAYSWIFVSKYGGTLGKLLFGLRIVGQDGEYIDKSTSFWRMTVGYSLSSGFMCLGYLWAFRKKENLMWHDRIFSTKVIKIAGPWAGIFTGMLLTLLNVLLVINSISSVAF